MILRSILASFAVLGALQVSAQATYPPNIDYGQQGDFITKVGTEFGRTADLMMLGPMLINLPEGPGSTGVAIDAYRFEDTVWDISDLTNPQLVKSMTEEGGFGMQPIAAHATVVRFTEEHGPLLWWGDDWMRFDPEATNTFDQIQSQFYSAGGYKPLSYTNMFSPYYTRAYWDYGFNADGVYAIRDPSRLLPSEPNPNPEYAYLGVNENQWWLGEPLVDWDHLGQTGVTGFTAWLGNLLVVSSDQQSTGMAIYDVSGFKEGNVPRLLSVFNPQLEEPEHDGVINSVGIGGYWMEPYGTNKMVFAARERIEFIPSRRHSAMFVVDFSDPTAPYLSCAIYFNQDQSDPRDGDGSSDPMYVNFQDQYAYVDHFKVDIPACEAAFDDGEISQEELFNIVYTFDDIANGCDGSQYFRPLGQVGIFGGYDFYVTEEVNEQGMCFFVTSDEPDNTKPYISGHRPTAGQMNYPVDGFIHLHIPETLRTETVEGAFSLVNVDTDTPVPFVYQLTHTGTVSIWPNEDLAPNTTYEVSVEGIQDFMANTMDPYSFVFSTGNELTEVTPTPTPTPEATPTPSYSGVAYYPNQSSQLACEPEVESGNVWVVNPDNNSIAIIDRNTDATTLEVTHTLNFELSLNYETPTSVSKINSVFAVTHRDDDKVVIYSASGLPLRAIDTGYGTQPVASVASGDMLYVALYGSGEVISIDSSDWEIAERLTVGPKPKAMALYDDRLLVTRFISTADYGEIYDLDVSNGLSLTRVIQANKVLVPDDDDHGMGVPNYLSSIVISADGAVAYVTANKANTERGTRRNGEGLDGDNTIRPMIITLDLDNNQDANTDPATRQGSIDLDNGADPSAITFLANPNIRMHALRGNNIVVANNLAANTSAQFNVGLAPSDMCATLRTLYVKNFTERTVSAIDVSGYIHDGALNPPIEAISTVSDEILTGQELLGLQEFYAARIPEMGPEGYMSCSSCHFDGGDDGMVWDISNLGEGFRNTLPLNGTSGTRFGDLHWSGNFDEVQDFELQMEELNEGDGLVPGRTFNGETPLELTTSALSTNLDALAAYIGSLGKSSVKRSPYRDYTGALTASAQRGRTLFYNDNCEQCHAGAAFRDGLRHDVGTIGDNSGNRLGGVLDAIRTPTLVQLWETAPYFHDGSAATLSDVLSRGDHARDLSAQDEADLIAFLNSLDRSDFIEDSAEFVPGASPDMADLNLGGGEGGGRYEVGSTITITAEAPPEGEIFLGWIGDVDTVADVNSPETTVEITSENLTLSASFGPDPEAPSAPGSLVASDITLTNVTLTWTASTDNVAVTNYEIFVNDVAFGERTLETTFRLYDLTPATAYDIRVVALDARGNVSDASNTVSVETLTPSDVTTIRSFFFGHSLMYHTFTDYPNKNDLAMPYWVAQFASANGQTLLPDGEFRTSNYQIPPEASWGFEGLTSAWQGDFASSDYDAVVYTELNFIQDVPPDTVYYDGSGDPISSVLRVLDYAREQEPGINFYLYENWPDAGILMPEFDPPTGSNVMPTSQQVAAYHELALGVNHDWWLELQDEVSAIRDNVKMVPLGPIISGLLTEIPELAAIPFQELYEDNAPHGLPSIYFIAGMIQYSAMYQQRLPAGYVAPSVIHSAVADNYDAIADYIWAELNDFNFPDGSSRVW